MVTNYYITYQVFLYFKQQSKVKINIDWYKFKNILLFFNSVNILNPTIVDMETIHLQ